MINTLKYYSLLKLYINKIFIFSTILYVGSYKEIKENDVPVKYDYFS